MPCKRSFFSPTLFKKNLTRFWPVWGLASLGGTMIPLWLLLGLVANRASVQINDHLAQDFVQMLYEVVAYAVPYVTIAYAILCAMLVWGYLMNARAVGLMHALPADRTCLFVTGTASGLAMMLIPYVITGALVSLVALCWGFMDFKAVCLTALAVILMTVTYFGIATFCAMITGNSFAVPVLYVLLNFLSIMVTALFSSLYTSFFLGVTESNYTISSWLCPPAKILQNFEAVRDFVGETYTSEGRVTVLHGWGTLFLYAGVGLALLGLSWLLYRLRHSESAGDVMVFRWLRPVFRYGVAFLSALTVGRLFYVMLWESVFQKGDWCDPVPMGFCLAAGGILGYYIASMLLEKSLRVFKGSLRGVGAVCAGVLVLTLWLGLDPFGLETRVPDAGEVESVRVSGYNIDMALYAGQYDEDIREVVDLHQAIVDDRAYIKDQENIYRAYGIPYDEESQTEWQYVGLTLRYTLKNGSELERVYNMYVTTDRAEDPNTFDGKLEALVSGDQALRARTVEIPRGTQLIELSVYNWVEQAEYVMAEDEWNGVLDAIKRDLAAGNIPRASLFGGTRQGKTYDLELHMRFQVRHPEDQRYSYRSVSVYPTMTETIQYLIETGYLDTEKLMDLQRDYLQDYTTATGDHEITEWGLLTQEELQALMEEYGALPPAD